MLRAHAGMAVVGKAGYALGCMLYCMITGNPPFSSLHFGLLAEPCGYRAFLTQSTAPSESKLQLHLNIARRISRGQRPECRTRQVRIQAGKVRYVECVEEIALIAQFESFANRATNASASKVTVSYPFSFMVLNPVAKLVVKSSTTGGSALTLVGAAEMRNEAQ